MNRGGDAESVLPLRPMSGIPAAISPPSSQTDYKIDFSASLKPRDLEARRIKTGSQHMRTPFLRSQKSTSAVCRRLASAARSPVDPAIYSRRLRVTGRNAVDSGPPRFLQTHEGRTEPGLFRKAIDTYWSEFVVLKVGNGMKPCRTTYTKCWTVAIARTSEIPKVTFSYELIAFTYT